MKDRRKGLKYKTKEKYDYSIYDEEEHLLAVLGSIKEVVKYTGASLGAVYHAIQKETPIHGYMIYKFEKEDESELI